jgi:iron complex transport system ATP-binding protein
MKHAVAMMQQLRRTADDFHKTIVLVLHDINFAAAYADHMVAMKHGRVIHQGTPRDLMQSAVLRDIYEVDVRVVEIDGRPVGIYYR